MKCERCKNNMVKSILTTISGEPVNIAMSPTYCPNIVLYLCPNCGKVEMLVEKEV